MLQKKKEKKEKKKKINDFPGNWKKQKGEGTHFHLPRRTRRTSRSRTGR